MRRATHARDERNGPVSGRRPMICNPLGLPWRVRARAGRQGRDHAKQDDRARAREHAAGGACRRRGRRSRRSALPRPAPRCARRSRATSPWAPRCAPRTARACRHELTDARRAARARVGGDLRDAPSGAACAGRRRTRSAPASARCERELNAPAASPALQAIAACESGGNPRHDTGNGFYGKYQFTIATWAPSAAPAIRPRPPRPSRTAARRCSTRARARLPGRSAGALAESAVMDFACPARRGQVPTEVH